jgi:hypothetical protein
MCSLHAFAPTHVNAVERSLRPIQNNCTSPPRWLAAACLPASAYTLAPVERSNNVRSETAAGVPPLFQNSGSKSIRRVRKKCPFIPASVQPVCRLFLIKNGRPRNKVKVQRLTGQIRSDPKHNEPPMTTFIRKYFWNGAQLFRHSGPSGDSISTRQLSHMHF